MDGNQIFYIAALGIVGTVFFIAIPVLGHFWHETRKVEQNAVLKKAMIDRGFTADEIIRVVNAGGDSAAATANRPGACHARKPEPALS